MKEATAGHFIPSPAFTCTRLHHPTVLASARVAGVGSHLTCRTASSSSNP